MWYLVCISFGWTTGPSDWFEPLSLIRIESDLGIAEKIDTLGAFCLVLFWVEIIASDASLFWLCKQEEVQEESDDGDLGFSLFD